MSRSSAGPGWTGGDEAAEPSSARLLAALGPVSAARPGESAPVEPSGGPALGGGRVVLGGATQRMLLLSFDDGPGLRSTERLLQVLRRRRLEAAFFLTTAWLRPGAARWRQRRAMARRIAAEGHLLGAHGFEHVQLPMLSNERIEAQLDATARWFEETLGAPVRLFRPPGGARSPRTDRLIEQRGWTQVLWNLGTGDTQVREARQVVRTFLRVLRRREQEAKERGGIVLLHDIHPWSVEAVPLLLEAVEERNCALWRAGEELFDWVPARRAMRWFVQPRPPRRFGLQATPARAPDRWWRGRQARLRREAARRCGPPGLGPLARR